MAGQAFNIDGQLNIYVLLTSWRHGIKPEENKRVASTVNKHGSYTVQCVQDLHGVCHITMKYMKNNRLCVDFDLKNHVHLNMEALD